MSTSAAATFKMGRLRRIATTLRNHWKKSTLAVVLASYGAHQVVKKNQEFRMMTSYCKEAQSYGDRSLGRIDSPAYHVTVILNPASDGGKGRNKYENYCEPLLHLAGFKVSTIRTEGQGQAKEIVEKLEKSDAVLVAGGDGSIMEAVTGLLRRPDAERVSKIVPFGILPVGKNNFTARQLFPGIDSDVKLMAEAAMAVVRGFHKNQDVLQVENVSQDSVFSGKKIYCLRQFQMGALTDAHMRVDKYWYLPFVKKYATYFFTYFSSSKNILRHCSGTVDFGKRIEVEAQPEPAVEEVARSGFWSYIVPSSQPQKNVGEESSEPTLDYEWEERGRTEATEMIVRPRSRGIHLRLAPEQATLKDFLKEGWSREYDKNFSPSTELKVGGLRWSPDFASSSEDDDKFFYVDNEPVEIMGAIELTVLPKRLRMFCHQNIHDPLPTAPSAAPKAKVLNRRMESASFTTRF